MRRGQMSVEYVMILGMVFAILIPAVIFVYAYSQTSASKVEAAQYAKLGQELQTAAIQTAALGKDSWITVDVTSPKSLHDINVTGGGHELTLSYNSVAGPTAVVYYTAMKLQSAQCGNDCSIFSGEHRGGHNSFRFTTTGKSEVTISDVFATS